MNKQKISPSQKWGFGYTAHIYKHHFRKTVKTSQIMEMKLSL